MTQPINNTLVYFCSNAGLMAYDGKDIKPVYTAYDPASPDGDFGCEVTYRIGESGEQEIESFRYLAKKPKLGKKRKRNE